MGEGSVQDKPLMSRRYRFTLNDQTQCSRPEVWRSVNLTDLKSHPDVTQKSGYGVLADIVT